MLVLEVGGVGREMGSRGGIESELSESASESGSRSCLTETGGVEGAVENELPSGREVDGLEEEEGRFSSCCKEKRADAIESVGRAAGVVGAGEGVDFFGGCEVEATGLEEPDFETGSREGISSESESSFAAFPFLLFADDDAPLFDVDARGAETDSRAGMASESESESPCFAFCLD